MALPDPRHSLGYACIAWIEHHLVHGPGDVQGQPIELDVELSSFLVAAYEVDDDGRRTLKEAFFSRSKGRAKSELAGMVVCFEFVGPARFDHHAVAGEQLVCPVCREAYYDFDEGEPVGKPVVYPFIRCLATEEGQAGNTYDNVTNMLVDLVERHGAAFPSIDIGQKAASSTRVFLAGGGEIRPSTASSSSKDGGKETFSVFDEALALDTPLPTPTGWTSMKEVCVGDELIGADGRPTRVLKVTEVQEGRDCYRVTFKDGSSIVASDGHLWQTKVNSSAAKPRVRTTGEMVVDGRRFMVPAGLPWQTSAVDLDIDPFVLGLWLGDGDARNATITVGEQDRRETAAAVRGVGYSVTWCETGGRAPLMYVSTLGSHRNRFSPVRGLKVRLRDAGLLANKHVPAEYLRASLEQRTSLLRGLMDSDGSVTPSGHCTFVNTSERLVDDLLELLRTLGEAGSKVWCADTRSRQGGYWKVHFTPRYVVPFSLTRKAERVQLRPQEWTSITSIEPVESVPVRCVAVEADDHLFMAGARPQVTHNTHLYVLPELRKMYDTVKRNGLKRKMQPWLLQTSTMYGIGEESIAETTHKSHRAGKLKATLFDHVEAPADLDPDKRSDRIKGLKVCYGPAAEWMPIEDIADEYDDPRVDRADWLRFFWNRAVAGTSDFVNAAAWDALVLPDQLRPRDAITLGFDGGRSDDSTALVACRLSDGMLFEIAVWLRPKEQVGDWRVPREAVDAMVTRTMGAYDVIQLWADPNRWEPYLDKWGAAWPGVVAEEWPSDKGTDRAVRLFLSGVKDGSLHHDGSELLSAHVKAAALVRGRLRPASESGDDVDTLSRHYLSMRKKGAGKIDAAWAATLAYKARGWCLEKGRGARIDVAASVW